MSQAATGSTSLMVWCLVFFYGRWLKTKPELVDERGKQDRNHLIPFEDVEGQVAACTPPTPGSCYLTRAAGWTLLAVRERDGSPAAFLAKGTFELSEMFWIASKRAFAELLARMEPLEPLEPLEQSPPE